MTAMMMTRCPRTSTRGPSHLDTWIAGAAIPVRLRSMKAFAMAERETINTVMCNSHLITSYLTSYLPAGVGSPVPRERTAAVCPRRSLPWHRCRRKRTMAPRLHRKKGNPRDMLYGTTVDGGDGRIGLLGPAPEDG